MGKLIDAQHFLDRVLPLCSIPEALQKNVDEEPAVDAAPIIHAHWIRGEKLDRFWCSHCNRITYTNITPFIFDYCFSCGAKMDDIGDQNGM